MDSITFLWGTELEFLKANFIKTEKSILNENTLTPLLSQPGYQAKKNLLGQSSWPEQENS